jgi:hypothetical protein
MLLLRIYKKIKLNIRFVGRFRIPIKLFNKIYNICVLKIYESKQK